MSGIRRWWDEVDMGWEKTVYLHALATLDDIPEHGSQGITISGVFASMAMENVAGVLTYIGQHFPVYRSTRLGGEQADTIANVIRDQGVYVYHLIIPDGDTPRGLVTLQPFEQSIGVWKALTSVTQM